MEVQAEIQVAAMQEGTRAVKTVATLEVTQEGIPEEEILEEILEETQVEDRITPAMEVTTMHQEEITIAETLDQVSKIKNHSKCDINSSAFVSECDCYRGTEDF